MICRLRGRHLTAASDIYSEALDRPLRGRLFVLGDEFAIELLVTLRGYGPGEISPHCALHQFSPQLAIAKNLPRPLDRVPKGFGRIFVTEKPVTAVCSWIVILDDFLNSAGGTRDRKRAVFQTVHRAQTSRLEARWNQTDVHPGFDHVRALFVVDPAVGKFSRKPSHGNGERCFVGWISLTQNNQPDVVGQKAIEQWHQDIETFLANDARHHSKHRAARLRIQSQTIKQRVAAELFSRQLAGRVISRKQFVGFGIPAGVISAVQNGAQFVRIFTQHRVKTATELWRLNLAFVPLAHGRDFVGKKNAGLEEVQFAEKFHAAKSEEALVQIGQAKVESPETALLRDVMNGKDGREWQMMRPHINRHECSRPIMNVQNLRRRSQAARQFHGCLAEKNKSSGVVFISSAVFTIYSVTIKKFVAPNKK